MKHRSFAAALTALTLLTLPAAVLPAGAPLTAQAESFGELTYAVYTDHVVITDCDKAAVNVTIPEEIGGLPVTGIGTWAFLNCTSLTSVTVPEGVTSIGQSAFVRCKSLSTIVIPESVTSIGGSAFSGTAWYDSQPDGMVYAGRVAYGYKGTCTGEVVLRPGTAGITDECFNNQGELSSVIIPEGVTSIGESAFYGCTGLTSVTIPEGVTSIAGYAFYGCTGLSSIVIPEGVTSIGETAFYGCTSLSTIIIPDSVTSFGGNAFDSTPFLEEKRAEDPLVIFGQTVYDGKTCAGDVVIPEYITSICEGAFFCAADVTSVTVLNPECSINEEICQSREDNYFFERDENGFILDTHNDFHYIFNGTIYGYENSTAQAYVQRITEWKGYFDTPVGVGYKFVSIESLQAAAPGDLDASGDKTVLDAVLLQKHLVRQGHLNAFQT
ncbi:MAG: leucine-rich repeat protein, partial [Oscillospiraceae bacterium]|nr:leucine-rich repeat protein [Oscillospiraceae bacterium]